MHIENLLDKNTSGINSTANGGLGHWTATNASLLRTTKRSHSGVASIIIDATGETNPVAYSGSQLTYVPASRVEYGYRGFTWFHSENPGEEIEFGIQFYDTEQNPIEQTSAHYSTFAMGYTEWELASVEISYEDIPLDAKWMSLVVRPADNAKIWIDDSVIYEKELITEVSIVKKLINRLPEYFVVEDQNQTNPKYPLLSFLDSAATTLGHIDQLITDFGYYSMGDATHPEATSTLVDPATFTGDRYGIQYDWLFWLSRVIGIQSNAISDSAGKTADWSQLETEYATWTEWEEDINANELVYSQAWSAVERTSDVVTVTLPYVEGDHEFNVGDSIYAVASGGSQDSTLYGYFEITEVITSPSYQIKYVAPGSNVLSSAGKTGTIQTQSDLNWQSIEGSNSYPVTPPQGLAKFIETGASGVWAGTIEGMRRAARIVLTGVDVPIVFEVADGVLTATSSLPHGLTEEKNLNDTIEIYGCPLPQYNRSYTIDSVPTSTTFTVSCNGSSVISKGHATNKIVDFERGYWNGAVAQAAKTSTTITLTFQERIPVSSITGNIVITGDSRLAGTITPTATSISDDRYSLVITGTFTGTTFTNQILIVTTKAKLNVGSQFCFVAQTVPKQTSGGESVIEFTNFAKPAGGIVTHEYAS
jgi:hypothetical protein